MQSTLFFVLVISDDYESIAKRNIITSQNIIHQTVQSSNIKLSNHSAKGIQTSTIKIANTIVRNILFKEKN